MNNVGVMCELCASSHYFRHSITFKYIMDSHFIRCFVLLQLLQKGLEPLLKVAPVLGARHKAGHIQRQQPPSLQHPGHVPAGDALGKALGKGRFAHARLPHQTGVILLAAAQDLHHPVQLRIPAEHRVQLAVRRPAGQIAAVFVAGPAPPRQRRRRARLDRQDELP